MPHYLALRELILWTLSKLLLHYPVLYLENVFLLREMCSLFTFKVSFSSVFYMLPVNSLTYQYLYISGPSSSLQSYSMETFPQTHKVLLRNPCMVQKWTSRVHVSLDFSLQEEDPLFIFLWPAYALVSPISLFCSLISYLTFIIYSFLKSWMSVIYSFIFINKCI